MTLSVAITVKDDHADVVIARRYTGCDDEASYDAERVCDKLEPAIYETIRGMLRGVATEFKSATVNWDGVILQLPPTGQTK